MHPQKRKIMRRFTQRLSNFTQPLSNSTHDFGKTTQNLSTNYSDKMHPQQRKILRRMTIYAKRCVNLLISEYTNSKYKQKLHGRNAHKGTQNTHMKLFELYIHVIKNRRLVYNSKFKNQDYINTQLASFNMT